MNDNNLDHDQSSALMRMVKMESQASWAQEERRLQVVLDSQEEHQLLQET